jgi:hypothetical protein
MPSPTTLVDIDAIHYLKRKARAARLEAGRASPSLAAQLKSLAALYEANAERMAGSVAASQI